MNRTAKIRSSRRSTVLALAAATAGLAAVAGTGAPAYASSSAVLSCSSASGVASYAPGLTATTAPVSESLTATLGGCSDLQQALGGNGSLVAFLQGSSSSASMNEQGVFSITWPSFYNPSQGKLSVTGPVNGVYTVSGQITAGAFIGATISTQYSASVSLGAGTSASPRTAQALSNGQPFKVLRNFG